MWQLDRMTVIMVGLFFPFSPSFATPLSPLPLPSETLFMTSWLLTQYSWRRWFNTLEVRSNTWIAWTRRNCLVEGKYLCFPSTLTQPLDNLILELCIIIAVNYFYSCTYNFYSCGELTVSPENLAVIKFG